VLATTAPDGSPEAAVVGSAVTDALELVFDTLDSTRKAVNLRNDPRIAFVIGWDDEQTVQLEGLADEPRGPELEPCGASTSSAFRTVLRARAGPGSRTSASFPAGRASAISAAKSR
jgi:hypothetical protein